jgi:hypothetical protein
MLSEAAVPLDVPRCLEDLAAFASTDSPGKPIWADGPQALTEIRNSLVHPTKRMRALDLPDGVMSNAAILGIWYLELSLMFLLGYDDVYVSRVGAWSKGPVPWRAPEEPIDPGVNAPPLLPRQE